MKQIYALLAASLIGCQGILAQSADDTIFSYASPDAETRAIGWGRKVDNDVAIFLQNPVYEGYEVIGISVDIPVLEGCEVAPVGKAWLTSTLTVDPETYKNVPDIGNPEGVEGEIKNVGTEENPQYRLDITFPDPYVLPAEGVYVGYTLTVTQLKNSTQKYPVSITDSSNPKGGLWMHAGYSSTVAPARYKEWNDLGSSNQAVSTMRVILRGHTLSNGGLIVTPANIYAQQGSIKDLSVEFFNYGSENVTSAAYTVSIDDNDVNGTITFDSPIGAQGSALATIPVAIPAESGDYTLTLTTDKINGEENLYGNKSVTSALFVRPWIPRKRVLVEDYSGTWCGWCPEAYVTLKQLQDIHPEDVIAIALHIEDQLMTIEKTKMPCPTAGTPELIFDRVERLDNFPEAPSKVEECIDMLAPADLDVKIYWADGDKKAIRAESTLKFIEDADNSPYLLTYALVEDNMTSPTLKQRNFFNNAESYSSEYYKTPYWDLFVGQPYEVSGIVYDETAMIYNDCQGIPGSLPTEIKNDKTYTHHTEFTLSDAKNVYSAGAQYGKEVIMNPDNLRVVAVLLDTTTGRAVNVNTSSYAADAPIYDPNSTYIQLPVEEEAEVIATEYYSLNGLRLATLPATGAYIVVKHLANGNIITAKYLHPLQ
ncbi:MAG: hypothetical protein K2J15_05685 [Muribaculaceae bacterium]|nr:hypothetical protein [Muribaculaceae bacterium]